MKYKTNMRVLLSSLNSIFQQYWNMDSRLLLGNQGQSLCVGLHVVHTILMPLYLFSVTNPYWRVMSLDILCALLDTNQWRIQDLTLGGGCVCVDFVNYQGAGGGLENQWKC